MVDRKMNPIANNVCCVGLYLASGGQDKKLVMWDVEKKEVLAQKDTDAMPGALAWHTGDKGNTLASIGEDGQIHLWQSVVPPHMLAPLRRWMMPCPSRPAARR